MSEEDKQAARTHMGRSRTQATHAVKNAGRAAALGAEIAGEEIRDTAEDVIDEVQARVPRVSASGLSVLSGDLGVGFLATSVSIYAGLVAFHKFRAVFQDGGSVIRR
jgi:hypothetical protein